ncbi:hypothetical protein ABZX40_34290 [Streptomyces sp. NPDC004610]|uniref:hypothetical protein n=1 Tax=unclassified Streptomyces TaxID=2593676 RepID=UPI0033AD6306
MNDDDGGTQLWIGTIPSLDPDTPEVFLGLDHTSADPGERLVCGLLGRGHEGEEGVFYLLPEDLSARYERTGDRLSVTLVSHRAVLAREADDPEGGDPEAGDPEGDALPVDPRDPDYRVLLRRETVTDLVPPKTDGTDGGEPRPLLLLDHTGGPVTPAELIARFERGEGGITVVGATV